MPKTSRLAIVAFALAILSVFTCGLSILPAIVTGIISFIRIERNGGRVTGTNLALLAIVGPVILLLLSAGIFAPAVLKMRRTDRRMKCGTNLMGISKAMVIYAND